MHHKMLCIQGLNPTSVEIPTQVQNKTQVETEPQVDGLNRDPGDIASPRTALVQDSSVELESRALAGLERGYTRLPNQILMLLASGNVTRNEIRIVLLIARFTISFRREMAPLSKNVLERQSGLRGAAILEAISGLVAKGIVRKTQGDHNRPNLLGLVLPDNWDGAATKDNHQTDKVLPQILPFPRATADRKPDQAPAGEATTGEAPIATPIKDIRKYKTINSPPNAPENVRLYFESVKPDRKRESELRAFEGLSRAYAADEIAACMGLLLKRGVRVGKAGYQPCHSPMAYLSKAMEEVLRDVDRTRNAIDSQNKRQSDQKNHDAEKSVREDALALEFAAMEAAFENEFPTSERQSHAVGEFCGSMPFLSTPKVQRIYAIQKWFELNSSSSAIASSEN